MGTAVLNRRTFLRGIGGIAVALPAPQAEAVPMREIQNDLFDLGSDLCVPGQMGEKLRVPASYVERLEGYIDELAGELR